MKLMIASDIHGSAHYCGKMLEAYAREKAERLMLLGDILYHGPRNDLPEKYAPKEVIALLSPLKQEILCVRGNCDTEVDQMVLPFPIMAEYCFFRIRWNHYIRNPRAYIQPAVSAHAEDRGYPAERTYPCARMRGSKRGERTGIPIHKSGFSVDSQGKFRT